MTKDESENPSVLSGEHSGSVSQLDKKHHILGPGDLETVPTEMRWKLNVHFRYFKMFLTIIVLNNVPSCLDSVATNGQNSTKSGGKMQKLKNVSTVIMFANHSTF